MVTKRRTPAQIAATKKLVAFNKARRKNPAKKRNVPINEQLKALKIEILGQAQPGMAADYVYYTMIPAAQDALKVDGDFFVNGYYISTAIRYALKVAEEIDIGFDRYGQPLKNPVRKKVTKKKTAKKKATRRKIVGTSQTKASIATGKRPTKRLKARRAANVKKGYYPNPKHKNHYIVKLVGKLQKYFDGSGFSTKAKAAIYHSKNQAIKIANMIARKTREAVYVKTE